MGNDWLARPRQPLPLPVVPVENETLTSYLRRLAAANRLDSEALRVYLTGDKRKSARVGLDTLALVSGQPCHVLRYAVLELAAPRDLHAAHVVARPRPGGWARPQCQHCTLSRGHGTAAAWCWNLHEDLLCFRHRRWIGDGPDYAHHAQPDLSGHPDILAANRRHRRLIRRHGRHAVMTAFREATQICDRWHQRRAHDEEFSRNMCIFHGPHWQVSATDPTIHAARYPQIVSLTRLLASPICREKALQSWPEPTEFIAEVRRTVAPHYTWTLTGGIHDPLVALLLQDLQPFDDANGTAHPQPAIETIGYPTRINRHRSRRLASDCWDG